MDFNLSQEQRMIRDNVHEFAQQEILLGASERDRTGRFPLEIIKKMAALGLMGLPVEEKYGGAGADYVRPAE